MSTQQEGPVGLYYNGLDELEIREAILLLADHLETYFYRRPVEKNTAGRMELVLLKNED